MNLKIWINRKTGKLHRGYQGNNPICNQRGNKRIPQLLEVSDTIVKGSPESAFCQKCFPQGKPA